MDERERLATQLENSLNGAWYGPALLEALRDVTAEQASARPIAGWKSIWEVAQHTIVWNDIVVRRLDGEAPQVELGGPEDFPAPPPPAGDAEWRATVDRVKARNAVLAAKIRALDPAKLDEPILPKYSSHAQHLHGVIQHNAYHTGQIVTLKRAMGLPAIAPEQG